MSDVTSSVDGSWGERFLTQPSYAGVSLPGIAQPEWVWNKQVGGVYYTIGFDDESGQTNAVDFPSFSSFAASEEVAKITQFCGHTLVYHRRIGQRARNYPRNRGLVSRPLREVNQEAVDGVLDRDSEQYTSVYLSRENLVPEPENSVTPFGWFAADRSPDDFGTPFVYPTHVFQSSRGEEHVVWCLGLSGVAGTPVATARWDDDEGCERLFRHVVDGDSEHLANVASFVSEADSNRVRAAKTAFDKEAAVCAAYDAWGRKQDQIKSRILKQVAESAVDSFTESEPSAKEAQGVALDVRVLSLVDSRSTGEFSPSIHAAVGVFVSHTTEPTTLVPYSDEALNKLVERIEFYTKHLRTAVSVLRVSSPKHVAFFLVSNPELFVEHQQAFGVPHGVVVEEQVDGEWKTVSAGR